MPDQGQPILLVAITARMLAELAGRAGYPVAAVDYFGDADLQALCPSRSLLRENNLPYSAAALVRVAMNLAPVRVIYGASLENHPAEVAQLGQGRQLLGNTPETLARVRHPLVLAEALEAGGFPFPRTLLAEPGTRPPEKARPWLWKPRRSGGGHGIRVWRGGPVPADGFFQERLAGLTGSAAFVADGRRAVVLGLTEQLIGLRFLGAGAFRYCGNLLPPRLNEAELVSLVAQVRRLANTLAETFGLTGLNGLDFVWQAGQAWPVEVNPRPSASLELIDRAYNIRVFDAHVRSFSGQLPDFDLDRVLPTGPAAGKAILYATRDIHLGDTAGWWARGWRDIPHPGESISRHHPVCTILTAGATPNECLRELKVQVIRIKQEFLTGREG